MMTYSAKETRQQKELGVGQNFKKKESNIRGGLHKIEG